MQARVSWKLVPIAESKALKKWRAQSEDRKLPSGKDSFVQDVACVVVVVSL